MRLHSIPSKDNEDGYLPRLCKDPGINTNIIIINNNSNSNIIIVNSSNSSSMDIIGPQRTTNNRLQIFTMS